MSKATLALLVDVSVSTATGITQSFPGSNGRTADTAAMMLEDNAADLCPAARKRSRARRCHGTAAAKQVLHRDRHGGHDKSKPEAKPLKERLGRKHGRGKAYSILAHRLGRASWYMLSRKQAFDLDRFLKTGN